MVGVVLVFVGAGFAGGLASSSAIAVNGASVSASTLRAEFAVIAAHPDFACYLGPALGAPITDSSSRVGAATAAEWTTLQLKGVAVERYDESHYGWRARDADLSSTATAYEGDLSNLAANYEVTCPTSAAAAFGALPAWFRTSQLVEDAASEVYTQHLKGALPLTGAGLRTIYNSNPANFETICVTLVEVPDGARKTNFLRAAAHGTSPAQLAKTYSIDSSGRSGGAVGCFDPTTNGYSSVVQFTSHLALNHFPTTAQEDSGGDSYFLAPTKRTVNPFSAVAAVVLTDAETVNAQLAAQDQATLLASSAVVVSPEFGQWTPTQGVVSTLIHPSKGDTPSAAAGLSP